MSAREHAEAGKKRRGLGGVVVWVAGGVGCRWRLAWQRVQRAVDIANKKKRFGRLNVPSRPRIPIWIHVQRDHTRALRAIPLRAISPITCLEG